MYAQEIETILKDFIILYEISEETYKKIQILLKRIDHDIHTEFHKCAGELKNFLSSHLMEDKNDENIKKLKKAIDSIKITLNYSVYLILGYSSEKIIYLSGLIKKIDKNKELVSYTPNIHSVVNAITNLRAEFLILEKNDDLNYIELYKKTLYSNEFRTIVEFCEVIPIIENNIVADHSRVIKDSQKFTINLIMVIFSSLLGLIAVVEELPNFIEYLSIYIPSLKEYIIR